MKKIVLLLAAVAALASCVKENTLAPEQTGDNLVTIKALAMDTKTTLGETTDDQTAVLWEAGDKIMVVYEGSDASNAPVYKEKIGENDYISYIDYRKEFSVTDFNGSSATFRGSYDTESFTPKENVRPFAVYPSSSVINNEYDSYRCTIKHNLPDVQDGKNLSDLLLSTAILNDEDLMAGTATTTFNNALALIYVTVPEGVTSVALTASYGIVGDATFTISNTYSTDSVWDDDLEDNVSNITEATGKLTGSGNKQTVTLSNKGNELEAGTYPVLIYPGYTSTFTVTMTGASDDVKFEKTLAGLTFTAGEYRNLNLTQIFQMEVKETETVSPMGAKLTIPVAATKQETYYVEENADWISVETSTYVQTKAFTGTNIVLNIEANTTGDSRTANVTITWGTDGEKTFTISQDSAYLDFVYVDPADPESGLIQWEESFGIFEDAALNSPVNIGTDTEPKYLTYKDHKFTIDFSDDPAKGTYVIDGMFVMNHALEGLKGGKYYANYEDGKLLVFARKNATQSYYFPQNGDAEVIIELAYDDANKTFSCADALAFNAFGVTNTDYSKAGYIGNYEAHHYVAPDPGAGDESSLNGTWDQSVTVGNGTANATVTLTVDDDLVTLTNFIYAGTVVTGTLSGNTITLASGQIISTMTGPLSSDLVLTISGDKKTITAPDFQIGGWVDVTGYTATKQ